jgi:hypothetical protein
MPLQNGTQKDVGLGPDFRRDDGKVQDDHKNLLDPANSFHFVQNEEEEERVIKLIFFLI